MAKHSVPYNPTIISHTSYLLFYTISSDPFVLEVRQFLKCPEECLILVYNMCSSFMWFYVQFSFVFMSVSRTVWGYAEGHVSKRVCSPLENEVANGCNSKSSCQAFVVDNSVPLYHQLSLLILPPSAGTISRFFQSYIPGKESM